MVRRQAHPQGYGDVRPAHVPFSVLFNEVSERTLKGQIEEQVRQEASAPEHEAEQVRAFQLERRDQLYVLYRLDRPKGERIFFRAANILTFNFGKSTIIKTQKGERDVIKIIGEALPRSVLLFTTAIVLEIVFGIWPGPEKAQKPEAPLDKTTSFITMVVYGCPPGGWA